MSGRRLLGGAVVLIALILLAGKWSASVYTDYQWYLALGARSLWMAKASTIALLTTGSFAIAAGFAFLNLYAVRQSVVSLVLPRRIGNIEIGEEVNSRYLFAVVSALAVAIGVALVFPPDRWTQALQARIGRPFGEAEANSRLDLGFFVYWLPFESAVHSWAVIVLTVVCVVVVLLYALTPSLRWERGTLYVSAYVRRHFMVLGSVVLLMLAWSYRLSMYRLLGAGSGPGGLFTSIDSQLLVPMLLLSILTLCAAVVVAWAGWTGQMRLAFSTVTVVLLMSLLARTVAPLLLRRAAESQDVARRDIDFLRSRLIYTRHAFGVDEERMRRDTIGAGFRSMGDVLRRVAIWDGSTLARAAERMRHVRVFGSGAAWTVADSGLIAQVVERGTESSPEVRDVWGLSRFDPAGADDKGQPVRAPAYPEDVVIGEPVVYDSAPGYSVLSDSLHQIVGVDMNGTLSRLMHAWSLQNFRLLFGALPSNRPIMVERRDVRERVAALAPFFEQGSEVVPLVANDTLYWIVELFSSSATYPLSQRITINGADHAYFQHAATAVVHAQSGRVRLVLATYPDPIAQSWASRLPDLFIRSHALPRAVSAALPPITDMARTQALAYATTGFRGDSIERRHFATPDGADSSALREPMRMALPELGGVSALWTLLDSTDRVRGVVAASGGPVRITSWIPMASDHRRWGTVVDRLRAADTSFHDAGASRAPLKVIPVAGKPLYLQPSFVYRPGGVPTLAHVAVFAADTVRSGATFAVAMGAPPPAYTRVVPGPGDLRARADSLYRVMRDALARGDWTTFGHAFDALGSALRVMPR